MISGGLDEIEIDSILNTADQKPVSFDTGK